MSGEAAAPLVAARPAYSAGMAYGPWATYGGGRTNFYPTYDGANDQVDRVTPVRRAFFQRVIPRYQISTSETRDEGVGPAFFDSGTTRPLRERRPDSPRPRGSAAGVDANTRPAGGAIDASGAAGASNAVPTYISGRPPLPEGVGTRVDIYV